MNIRENLLRYDTTTTLADYVLDYENSYYENMGITTPHDKIPGEIDTENFEPGSKIFIKVDLLNHYAEFLSKMSVPFHLMTGRAAKSPSTSDIESILKNKNVVSWVGTNIPTLEDRIMQVPIGFPGLGKCRPNSYIDIPNIPDEKDINFLMTPLSKDTHSSRNTLPKNSNLIVLEEKLKYLDYLNFLGRSKYSICPRGFGVDTHRVYESIVMGSIPIVLSSILDNLYSNIGCKILDSWEDINSLPVDNIVQPDRNMLTVEYWRNKILEHQKIREKNNGY